MAFRLHSNAAEGKCTRQLRGEEGLISPQEQVGTPPRIKFPEDRMLEMRQSGGVQAVTTMIFLDDLSRWVGFPKGRNNGDQSFGFYLLPINRRAGRSTFRQIPAPFGCAGSRTRSRHKYQATAGGLEIIADVLQKAFEQQKCSDFDLSIFNTVDGRRLRQRALRSRDRAEGTFERVS